MKLLEGRSAVITGGGQGLGLSIAAAFVAQGANVAVADIDERRAAEAVQSLGGPGRARAVGCDVNTVRASHLNRIGGRHRVRRARCDWSTTPGSPATQLCAT